MYCPRAAASGKQRLDLLATAPSISSADPSLPLTHDDQHTTAAGCVRDADAMLDIGTPTRTFLVIGAGQSLVPVRVIDGVVHEDARLADCFTGLLGRVVARLVEIDAIEAGVASQTKSFGPRRASCLPPLWRSCPACRTGESASQRAASQWPWRPIVPHSAPCLSELPVRQSQRLQ